MRISSINPEPALVTGCHRHRTDPRNLGKENKKTTITLWLHGSSNINQPVCISNVSASQAFSHKAALQDGGLERCRVINVKAPADGSAGSSSCGSDSL